VVHFCNLTSGPLLQNRPSLESGPLLQLSRAKWSTFAIFPYKNHRQMTGKRMISLIGIYQRCRYYDANKNKPGLKPRYICNSGSSKLEVRTLRPRLNQFDVSLNQFDVSDITVCAGIPFVAQQDRARLEQQRVAGGVSSDDVHFPVEFRQGCAARRPPFPTYHL
jgi:hypothetical protein